MYWPIKRVILDSWLVYGTVGNPPYRAIIHFAKDEKDADDFIVANPNWEEKH